ncbi:MAG: twin-arginine translocase TatA/TatE family subunit [Pyrinomonadaceae bacterium]|nr:twin-arginine translocase TatA/TatE family subunit [Pyrinomonadaceae bacterium]
MFLFILESIGTSELILIGMVALIIFGPRKLPELMRTFGKTMAEFRRSTNEFKASWEREVDLENFGDLGAATPEKNIDETRTIGRSNYPVKAEVELPAVKAISADQFSEVQTEKVKQHEFADEPEVRKSSESETREPDKRDWL